MAGRRSREIEIFSFSFLDILACTVGALIFIVVMVVCTTADTRGLLQAKQAFEEAKARKSSVETAVEKASGEAAQAEKNLADTKRKNPAAELVQSARDQTQRAEAQIKEQQEQTAQARAGIEKLETEQAQQQEEKDKAAGRVEVLKGQLSQRGKDESSGKILKMDFEEKKLIPNVVECAASGVINHGSPGKRTKEETPQKSLATQESAFRQMLVRIKNSRTKEYVVFLVRPDGLDAFEKARELAKALQVTMGWEPVNADWEISFK